MAPSLPRAPLQPRSDLKVVKQQLIFLVTLIATLFVLCPERYQFYRNLCVIPVLAWCTGMVFDLVILLNNKWDNAPAMVKYVVPFDFPDIKPPFDQIRGAVTKRMDGASTNLRQFWLRTRSLVLTFVNWLLSDFTSDPSNTISPGPEQKTSQPTPKPEQWVALVVATPIIYDANLFDMSLDTITETKQTISWEDTDVSSIPTILNSETFQVKLAVCLIPKSVWNSSKTMLDKFSTGLYWYHQPGDAACQGNQWDEDKIRTISKVQFIGNVREYKSIDRVNECFEPLREGWNDMNLYWSSIDFAIILAFLLVGKSSIDISKKLFDHFANLRSEQAHRNKDLNQKRLGAGAAVLTLLTGGLAAPITIPMMMGAGAAETQDRYLQGERISACQKLLERYEQLRTIIKIEEKEEKDVLKPKPPFSPPALEQSWFVDDSW
ncbi:hypothetical protein F53441_3614 [Fusarium austroafricanum]|uniref:Uncharacterized protein n=1 Tax=Fusarium austroafricanum TaxID=2364996 RepID=A0A8H4KQ95_9HYPO|nr:hypothetical protein F53441_3614 [Fusarium austroafricanum]